MYVTNCVKEKGKVGSEETIVCSAHWELLLLVDNDGQYWLFKLTTNTNNNTLFCFGTQLLCKVCKWHQFFKKQNTQVKYDHIILIPNCQLPNHWNCLAHKICNKDQKLFSIPFLSFFSPPFLFLYYFIFSFRFWGILESLFFQELSGR